MRCLLFYAIKYRTAIALAFRPFIINKVFPSPCGIVENEPAFETENAVPFAGGPPAGKPSGEPKIFLLRTDVQRKDCCTNLHAAKRQAKSVTR